MYDVCLSKRYNAVNVSSLFGVDKHVAHIHICLHRQQTCTQATAHEVKLSNSLGSDQSAINFETGFSENPHLIITFQNEAAYATAGAGVTIVEDNYTQVNGMLPVGPVCLESFQPSVKALRASTSRKGTGIAEPSLNMNTINIVKSIFLRRSGILQALASVLNKSDHLSLSSCSFDLLFS